MSQPFNDKLHRAVNEAHHTAGGLKGWNARFILAVDSAGLEMLTEVPDGTPCEDWIQAPNPVKGQIGEWFGVRYLMLKDS